MVLIILFVYSFKFIINHENMSTAYGLSCDDGVNAIKTDIEVRKEILNQNGSESLEEIINTFEKRGYMVNFNFRKSIIYKINRKRFLF